MTFIKVCEYSWIFILLHSISRLSLKLYSISHSPKNLIYNSGTEVGVGMEGWEKMEEKKKNIYLAPS